MIYRFGDASNSKIEFLLLLALLLLELGLNSKFLELGLNRKFDKGKVFSPLTTYIPRAVFLNLPLDGFLMCYSLNHECLIWHSIFVYWFFIFNTSFGRSCSPCDGGLWSCSSWVIFLPGLQTWQWKSIMSCSLASNCPSISWNCSK